MNRIVLIKLVVSMFLYISLFGFVKNVWELINGRLSKYIQIFNLSNVQVSFKYKEIKIVAIMEKVFNFFFWFIIWVCLYRTIKSISIFDNEQFILSQNEALEIGVTYLLLPPIMVVVAIILFAVLRDNSKVIVNSRELLKAVLKLKK